ncbi:MAG: sugar nucleotide-binding protein [Candidatus Diapherotrites archaeon]|nr:sugar nucleotide-binding protein [Candidatus Diapherotrites archaeon]
MIQMKILVAGHKGFLGKKIYSFLSKNKKIDLFPKQNEKPDYLNYIFPCKFDAVINCAGYADVDGCEKNKKKAFESNVILVRKLLEQCNKKTHFIHISSDYVLQPINYYAQTKKEAEELLYEFPEIDWCSLRVSGLYGFNDLNDKSSFALWVASQKGKKITVLDSNALNVTLIDDIALAIEKIIQEKITGIKNCVGKECLTKYDFAKKIYSVFGFNSENIIPSKEIPSSWIAERPEKIELKSDFKTKNAEEGLKEMKKQIM